MHIPATTTTSGTPRGDSTSQGRTRFVRILPTSVILPSGSPIDKIEFIEVNLAAIPTNTLQLVQVQVREREIITYQENEKLTKDNDQLRAKNESMKIKMMKQEYEESELKRSIEDLRTELPQCNISLDAPLSQKVKINVAKTKDLEETIEKMDAEHKACITKLKAKVPGMPP